MNQAFENYVSNYDLNDEEIKYKYLHSYRVKNLADILSQNFSEEDRYLANIIGLYHDIGRFEQDKKFNSFYDDSTFDHANYGVKLLIENNIIRQIPVEEKYYNIIEKAIKNHNKYKIEEGLTPKELLHAKIIRDADKLDILTSRSKGIALKKDINFNDNEFKIRESIINNFYSNKQIEINKQDKTPRTTAEKIIIYLAMIFDLNFDKSKDYLVKNNILNNLYNRLQNKDKYKEYFDYINKYLEKR